MLVLVHVHTAEDTLTSSVALIQGFCRPAPNGTSRNSRTPKTTHLTIWNACSWRKCGASAAPSPGRQPGAAEILHRSWASREAPDEYDAVKSCEDLGFLLRQLELTEIWRHSEISLRCPSFTRSEAPSRRKWSGRERRAVEVDIGVFRSPQRDRELNTGRPLALTPREHGC